MQDYRIKLVYGAYDELSVDAIGKTVDQARKARDYAWSIPADAVPMRSILGFAPYAATPGTLLKPGDTLEWIRLSKPAETRLGASAEPSPLPVAELRVGRWNDRSNRFIGMTVDAARKYLYIHCTTYDTSMVAWRGLTRLADWDLIKAGDMIEFSIIWGFKLRDCDDKDDKGKTKCREGWKEVTETEYTSYAVGSHYPDAR